MEKTKVKVEFMIVGEDDFNPDVATNLLGLQPTRKRIKGEAVKVTKIGHKLYAKNNLWELSTDYEESYDSRQQIDKVLSRLHGKEEILRQIYMDYNVDIALMVVVDVEEDVFPGIDIDLDLLQYLASIHCSVEFDQYYCSGIPPEENYENFAEKWSHDIPIPDNRQTSPEKTKVKVEFIIVGKDDQFKQPDVVTELLNIQPTSKAIDHKIIKVTDNNMVYKSKESFWELATDYEESYYSSKQIEKVLSKLHGKEEILRKIYEAYNVSIILMTVVKVEGDIFPVLDMDVDLIQYLSSIIVMLDLMSIIVVVYLRKRIMRTLLRTNGTLYY